MHMAALQLVRRSFAIAQRIGFAAGRSVSSLLRLLSCGTHEASSAVKRPGLCVVPGEVLAELSTLGVMMSAAGASSLLVLDEAELVCEALRA